MQRSTRDTIIAWLIISSIVSVGLMAIILLFPVHGQEAINPNTISQGKVYYNEKHIVITVGSNEVVWCIKGNPLKANGVCNSGQISENMTFNEISEIINKVISDND